MKRPKKFIFVTGGVLSGLGKGLSAAAIGALLEARGLRVTFLKLDPYLNVDPGTMNPVQHGEVYVTDDGAETDLDLGHYERFTSTRTSQLNNVTAGSVYHAVISKERRGDYLGGTVQVIPHIIDEIKERIHRAAEGADLLICEVGGTVGDIESLPFLEAVRQMRADVGRGNVCYVHLALVPFIPSVGELKTKPLQHSVKALQSVGIAPDVLLCRTDRGLPHSVKSKIALFCNVDEDAVITARDAVHIYEVPLALHDEGLDEKLTRVLDIWTGAPRLDTWQRVAASLRDPQCSVRIAMVGKYVDLSDSYKSLNEALHHGGIAHRARVEIEYFDSEKLDDAEALAHAHGILVPHGFGGRGAEGKIATVHFARERGVPFFGICYGMHMAVIEFARSVAGLPQANSTEVAPDTPHPVIDLLPGQREIAERGATMRLGAWPCVLRPGTRAREIYGQDEIRERHRHRLEFNPAYRERLEKAGMVLSGASPDGGLVELVELAGHPWFLGCQFHPEFKSTPFAPHPLFASFIGAAIQRARDCGLQRGADSPKNSAAGR